MATDFTHASPTTLSAFTAQWESRVRLGKLEGYGSLAVTGSTYTGVYNYASTGLQTAQAIDLGELATAPNITPTFTSEVVEAGNVRASSLRQVTEEGLVVTFAIREYQPDVIEQAIQNGTRYTVNTVEMLMTAGGACNIKDRPLEISAYNIGCYAPTSAAIASGILGFILTVYRGYLSSGFNFGDLVANALNQVELEYTAIPDTTRALGNQLYNLRVY